MSNKLVRDRFLAGLFTLILSAWLGIDSANIVDSIINFFEVISSRAEYPKVYYSAVLFIVSAIAWVLVFTRYLSTDLAKNEFQFEETISAIYRSPNPFIYNEYPNFYSSIRKHLEKFESDGLTPIQKSNLLKKILGDVLSLTQYFSTQNVELIGANVMFFLPSKEHDSLIKKLIANDQIKFTDDKRLEAYAGALITHPKTMASAIDKKSKRSIPSIGLPVFNKIRIKGKTYQMPGAAFAIYEGNYICYNISELIKDCEFMGASIVNEIENYFNKEGKDIKSFASFRIGSSRMPLGVLNIDSSEENVLGSASEYFATFNALLYPVLNSIEKLVVDVRDQFLVEINKELDKNLNPDELK